MPWDRPLTGIERWRWLFDRAAPMNLVFVARVDGRFDVRRLRGALGAIAEHYPHLTAAITPDRHPRFVSSDAAVDLSVRPWQPGGWRQTAVEEANTRIPTTSGPLIRATLLAGDTASDLIVTFHQAVADGRSGALIIDEILQLQGGGARPAVVAPEVLAPPLSGVLGSRFHAIRAALREKSRLRHATPLVPSRNAPPGERSTGLVDARLPATQTETLALRAAAHGSSVHGALAAALVMSVGQMIRSSERIQHANVACATAIDLRRHSALSSSAVGNFLSRVVSSHQVHHDTLFWDLASEISGAIREAARSGSIFAYARMKETEATAGSDADLTRLIGKAERSPVAAIVNNLGRLDFYRRYGDVELQRLGFLASGNVGVGSAPVLNVATVAGTTFLGFTYAAPLLTAERAQTIADGVLATLQEVIKAEFAANTTARHERRNR